MDWTYSRRGELISSNSLAYTSLHFFKVILQATIEDKKLMIPKKFVGKFGDELSAVVTFSVPNGLAWQVRLTKEENKIWFDDGWHDFVKYHSISAGQFLVFKYRKNSNFDVLIFDKTACEIQYPSYSRGQRHDEQNSLHQDETETDGDSDSSVEIFSSTTPKSPSNSSKAKFKHPNEGQLLDLLRGKGIILSTKYKYSSDKERKRIFNVARSLKPQYPSFMIFLWKAHMRSCTVYLPVEFANKYLTKATKLIKLQASDGRELPVQISWENRGCHTEKGWSAFARYMKLKAEDICLFELIRREYLLLKVSVF